MSVLDPRPLSLDPECVPQLEARAIAREVAVDVASHSAQVDPILAAKELVLDDELMKALNRVGKDILYPMG